MFWTRLKFAKADPDLVNTLRSAKSDELIRAVFLLGKDNNAGGQAPRGAGDVLPHGSRTARIEWLRQRAATEWRSVVDAMKRMGLQVEGGDYSPVVVVEGSARNVIRSLRLPGVEHARLDHPADMIMRPRAAH